MDTTKQRPPFRSALLGAAAGAAGAVVGVLTGQAVAAAGSWLWPTPDANIGLGLISLSAGAVVGAVGVWVMLRLLRLPRPGPTAVAAFIAALALYWLLVMPIQVGMSTTRYGYLVDPGGWYDSLWTLLRWALSVAIAVLAIRPSANRRRARAVTAG